jgi:hypothetical protein
MLSGDGCGKTIAGLLNNKDDLSNYIKKRRFV